MYSYNGAMIEKYGLNTTKHRPVGDWDVWDACFCMKKNSNFSRYEMRILDMEW